MMLGNPLLVLAFVTALFSLFLFLLGAKDKGKYQESGKITSAFSDDPDEVEQQTEDRNGSSYKKQDAPRQFSHWSEQNKGEKQLQALMRLR